LLFKTQLGITPRTPLFELPHELECFGNLNNKMRVKSMREVNT